MTSQRKRKHGTLFLGGSLLAVALAFAPGTAGLGTAAWAAPEPLNYVALGDSYAAGLGLSGPINAETGCGRTTSSYPQLLATALDLNLTDVTCSGATTENVISTPQDTGVAINPVQASALNADTDIVTLTIGGNDLGFSNIVFSCLAASATGPLYVSNTLPNCETIYAPSGGPDQLAAAIANAVSPALDATLSTVKALAPNAKIFVVGYPALMPDSFNTPTTGCFTTFNSSASSFPFTNVDVEYLHNIQSLLDTAMASAAGMADVNYVSMLADTLPRTSCANQIDAFVSGASNLPGAMHPTAIGASFMASTATNAILSTFTAPTITPSSRNYSVEVGVMASETFTTTGFPEPALSITGTVPAGMTFDADTGVLSGIPTSNGLNNFSITATNTHSSVTMDYTMEVLEAPTITSGAPTISGAVGTPYSFSVTASGYPNPTFTVTSGALPDGLILDAVSGAIGGTPTIADTFSFTVTATNSEGTVTSEEYTIAVTPANVAPEITSSTPPAAQTGNEYSFKVVATGFPAPTFAISSGALPLGLSLDSVSGVIHGTPTETGNFAFSITASNAIAPASTAEYVIEVTNPVAVTPVTPVVLRPAVLVSTGTDSLFSMGVAGSLLLLSGAGLIATRRVAKR